MKDMYTSQHPEVTTDRRADDSVTIHSTEDSVSLVLPDFDTSLKHILFVQLIFDHIHYI